MGASVGAGASDVPPASHPTLDMDLSRRELLGRLALATGALVLLPQSIACGGKRAQNVVTPLAPEVEIPKAVPLGWDPIAFNRLRGESGAIPEAYLNDVQSPSGEWEHVGQHLPYVVTLEGGVPEGFLALMWGDPQKGHARHPQEPRGPSNQFEGHWFRWIRVRKATIHDVDEVQSTFTDWPTPRATDSGDFALASGDDILADSGKNTVYLVALPPELAPGDLVRIHARCTLHGEYIDFVQI